VRLKLRLKIVGMSARLSEIRHKLKRVIIFK
jgi:hypothetical protein